MTARAGMAMCTVPLVFGFLCLISCPLPAAQDALEQQAEAAWQDRDQEGRTLAAIALWERLLEQNPEKYKDVWIKLAKAMGRAVRHAATPAEARAWADRARKVAEQAVKESPETSMAYTVYGEALGQWAQARKGIRSLQTIRKAVDALEKAVALDPQNAYAHMLLAEFYRQSPRFISIGNKPRGLKHACLAVGCGGGYAINHLVLARAYLDAGKKDQAVEELQIIMKLTSPPDAIPETRADQETAREMLSKMGIQPIETRETSPVPAREPNQCGGTSGYCSEVSTP